MTEDQAKGMTQSHDFWCSYEGVKDALRWMADNSRNLDGLDVEHALQMLVMWGDHGDNITRGECGRKQ